MSSFLIKLWSNEKSYTIPFKEISLCSSFVKSFDMLPKKIKPTYAILHFKFVNLCFIYIQVTLNTILM